MTVREKVARRAARAGVSASDAVLDGLEAYFDLLRKWNRKVSLTSLPVEECGDEAVDRLLVEPLLAARFLPVAGRSILDIGSGGGSPAIPLKLALPAVAMRMVESKTRKAAFLREVIRALALDNTQVDAVRFEELLGRPVLHETADAVTLRAVRVEGKTLAGLQFFLRPGGLLLLFGARSRFPSSTSTPQLIPMATHVLLKEWGSQLDVLQKISV